MSDQEPTPPDPPTEPVAESPPPPDPPTAPPLVAAAEPAPRPARRRPSNAILATAGIGLALGVLVGVAGAELVDGGHDRPDGRTESMGGRPNPPSQNDRQDQDGDRQGNRPDWGARSGSNNNGNDAPNSQSGGS